MCSGSGQEGSGSTERLHAKVGDRMHLPPCLFPVIYHWVSPPWLLHKIDKIKMAGTSRDISSAMTSAANNYNTRLDSSVRIKTRIRSYAPKSHKIEYVPMHTIREITRLATMLARLIAPRIRLGFVSASISCEHCRSSHNNPHCASRHVIYY